MYLAFDLTLPTETAFVQTTRGAISGYLDGFGVPRDLAADVVLAIDEACANAIQHAYPGGEGSFRLQVRISPAELTVEVSDAGVGFDVLDQPVKPHGRMASSGRGIELMRRLVTRVEIESSTATGGTCVRLRQVLPAAALK